MIQPPGKSDGRSLKTRLMRFQVRVRRRVPPGLRLLLGALLMVGGVLGFLPILGFWMIPLGVAVAALDVVPLWRAGLKRAAIPPRDRDRD